MEPPSPVIIVGPSLGTSAQFTHPNPVTFSAPQATVPQAPVSGDQASTAPDATVAPQPPRR